MLFNGVCVWFSYDCTVFSCSLKFSYVELEFLLCNDNSTWKRLTYDQLASFYVVYINVVLNN